MPPWYRPWRNCAPAPILGLGFSSCDFTNTLLRGHFVEIPHVGLNQFLLPLRDFFVLRFGLDDCASSFVISRWHSALHAMWLHRLLLRIARRVAVIILLG